jgi:hypothetical protein
VTPTWSDDRQNDRTSWRLTGSYTIPSGCTTATLLARPPSPLVRASWGAVWSSRHHTPEDEIQLRGVPAPPTARRRGGRHNNSPTGARAIRPAKSRAGTPTIHLTRTAREATSVSRGDGRQEAIAVPPPLKGTRARRPRRLFAHDLGQPSPTTRPGHTCGPHRGQPGLLFAPSWQDLRGRAAAHHS